MRKVEYWVAEDGEEFDTEKECYDYEHQYDDLANRVILLKDEDTPMKRTAVFKKDLEVAYCIIVPDDNTALDLMDFMNHEGMENPWDKWNGFEVIAGHYTWEDDGWHCIEEELKECERKLEALYKTGRRAMEV